MKGGLIISAPASGAGKTTLFLGLVRSLFRRGLQVQAYKNGPDYIDPAFHAAASNRPSYNLDSWAMGTNRLEHLLSRGQDADLGLVEGSMGLFDGVASLGEAGTGATADLAAHTRWPVVIVLDGSGQAQTAGAVALGLASYRPDIKVIGAVLNRIASSRHEALARRGIEATGLRVYGVLPKNLSIEMPERHLGLIQACERPQLQSQLDTLADKIDTHVDVGALLQASMQNSGSGSIGSPTSSSNVVHFGQPKARIALAQDQAFSFTYPHVLEGWRSQGCTILPFSPLNNQGPDPSADLCWLPGGYPELHVKQISSARDFISGLRAFAVSKPVHGECGGYMVLGQSLENQEGEVYPMAGLLGLRTSFRKRRMHLGYRRAKLAVSWMSLAPGTQLRGHEFHYASIISEPDAPLARVENASGDVMEASGSVRQLVSGSFFHFISQCMAKTVP
ncbi:MAG: cobyrinate a,c-diamide synthase [Myxococcales bacterium]|nr:cobyrinate a,c-diamide synthase [Myxococcales bacterium]